MADLEQVVVDINSMIQERNHLAIREIYAERAGYTLSWSNGAARWMILYPQKRRGDHIRLDSNQIFVSGVTGPNLRHMIDEGMLDPLPLYTGSFEATWR